MKDLRGIVALTVLLAGCPGGGKPTPVPAEPRGVAVIGAGGGSLSGPIGTLENARLVVAPGAVTSDTTFSIAAGTPVSNGAFRSVGPPVLISPPTVSLNGLQTITVPVDVSMLPPSKSIADVVVLQTTATGMGVRLVPSSTSGNIVTFSSSTLGTFEAVVATAGPPTVASVVGPFGGTPPLVSTLGGQTVTVTGTNFFPGASVTFGGVPATSVTVASQTQLTAVTPARSAGAVPVVVTNLDTQSGVLASAIRFEAGPVFQSGLGGVTITPPSLVEQTITVMDPLGASVSFALAPAVPNLAVVSSGGVTKVRFAPTIFQGGAFNVTLTASSASGTSQQTGTFTVQRPTSPQILFSDNSVFPGAPGGAGVASFSKLGEALGAQGEYATLVNFVGRSETGVLYRRATAPVASFVLVQGGVARIQPLDGVAIVASTGGPAPNLPGVTIDVSAQGQSLQCTAVGADGLAAFTAHITSDSGASITTALYLVRDAVVTGPHVRTQPLGSSGGGGTPTPGIAGFFANIQEVSRLGGGDGAGGFYVLALVALTSGGAEDAIFRVTETGTITLVARRGSVIGGRTVQDPPMFGGFAGAGGLYLVAATEVGTSIFFVPATGPARRVAETGTVFDTGGPGNTVVDFLDAFVSTRIPAGLLTFDAASGMEAAFAFDASISPVVSARYLRAAIDTLGGSPVEPFGAEARGGVEETSRSIAFVASTNAGIAYLLRGALGTTPAIVADTNASVVPIAGGRYASFSFVAGGAGPGGAATAWTSPVTLGTRPSGLFGVLNGGMPQALILEGDALPGGFPGTFGSFAQQRLGVHPESSLVTGQVTVTGAIAPGITTPYTRVVYAR